MFKALSNWFKQIFGLSQSDQLRVASLPQAESNSQMAEQFDSIDAASHLVPYDENLLERARTQWQFGDWHSLANLDRETLQHHPDRAKLVLLAAAGRLQIGQDAEARQCIRLAQDWGCSKKQISQVLISGVHNTIGMAAAIGGQQQRSALHFEKAIRVGSPSSDLQLLTKARTEHQIGQFGKSDTSKLIYRISNLSNTEQTDDDIVKALSEQCIQSEDLHAHIDRLTKDSAIKANVKNAIYLNLSKEFARHGDKLTAIHFATLPLEKNQTTSDTQHTAAIQQLIALGQNEQALRYQISRHLNALDSSSSHTQTALLNTFRAWATVRDEKHEHGHGLLISYLASALSDYISSTNGRAPVLVEIGSTRENVLGQGSTLKLAQFCLTQNIHFTSVDMDPHNTQGADTCFRQLGAKHFQAVNAKGEDFLAQHTGPIDFAFLDAYDFDHGNHSALRQSRYTRFLGAPISDPQCHQMHLDCAQNIAPKMPPLGVICIDDTWLDNGQWTAKGTLAMPYLLDNGFELIEARNRAALLRKKAGS